MREFSDGRTPPTERTRAIADTLRQRLEAAVHLGTLGPGDRLASVRDVSAEFRTGPRLVLAAYRRLADEGLVEMRARSGVFVRGSPRTDDPLPDVPGWLVDVFLRGLARGIAPTELRRQARLCLDTVRVRAACLECNDDQLYALCGQLRDDYGYHATPVDLDALTPAQRLARATDVDVIVTTKFHATEAERLGQRARRPVVIATLDAVFVTHVERMLAQGPVWWACTDARFAAKLPRMFPGSSVRPIVLGRDPLDVVPPGALVYATRAAARCLPAGWHGGNVSTVTRAFSADTARALVTLRVRRSLETADAAAGNSSRAPARAASTR